MLSPDVLLSLSKLLVESSTPPITLSKRGKLQIGKEYLQADRGIYNRLYKSLSVANKRKILETFGADSLHFGEPDQQQNLESALKSIISGTPCDFSKKEISDIDLSKVFFSELIDCPLDLLKLVVNVEVPKFSVLYDPRHDRVHRVEYMLIKERLREILGDDAAAWKAANTMDCHFEYIPHKPRFTQDGQKLSVFNSWTDAEWSKGFNQESPRKSFGLAQDLTDFLDALMPDKPSQRATLAWLRDATFGRAYPIMVLCGAPGVGKNILIERVARALVGKNNYRQASRGFTKSVFHNNITHCRLFMLDEMPLSNDARETLKAYHNGTSAIERKGVDVTDPEPIHASIAIANNDYRYIKLEYNDRKFFVPELSSTPLLKSLGQHKIDSLLKNLEDDSYLLALAEYLYQEFPANSSVSFPKTPFFRRICESSYPSKFRVLVDMCRSQESFNSVAYNRAAQSKEPYITIEDFLYHYEQTFGEKLGTLERLGDKWEITSLVKEAKVTQLPKAQAKAPASFHRKNNDLII